MPLLIIIIIIIIITNTAVPSVGAKTVSIGGLGDDDINNNNKYGCTFCRCKNCECSSS